MVRQYTYIAEKTFIKFEPQAKVLFIMPKKVLKLRELFCFLAGKPTTTHITERIIIEAKALLQHTDWNKADVVYSLGFEYPTYFNNFFKKMTGTNPTALRAQVV